MATRRRNGADTPPDHTTLTPFDGREVLTASGRFVGLGDGLSQALTLDAREYHIGDRVTFLVDCDASAVQMREIKDVGKLDRLHTFKGVTVVDVTTSRDSFTEILDEQKRRNEEAKGILALDLNGDEPDEDQ